VVAPPQVAERIELDGTPVEVRRSARRRTACLEVRCGRVRVCVPAATDPAWVEWFVRSRSAWIAEKLSLHAARPVPTTRHYVSGESYPFLGADVSLKLESAPRRHIELQRGVLRLGVPRRVRNEPAYVQRALVEWYRERALTLLTTKTASFGERVGKSPRSVTVRSFRRRWGSCSACGDIQFNWLVVAAPEPVVDYVVVHELCHLHHLDHSQAFWREVGRVLPDYRERRRWLREEGPALGV
jgi:predicted metal-dependent hydrolase